MSNKIWNDKIRQNQDILVSDVACLRFTPVQQG